MKNSDFEEARRKIAAYTIKTPLLFSPHFSREMGKRVFLKCELFQPTSSFKVRPAFYGILNHLEEARLKGVLTSSSGNYAQGVAYAAKKLGVKATIVMTDDTSPLKIAGAKKWGAEVVFCGLTFESRFAMLEKIEKERGMYVLHGFDSFDTIQANGSIALEILEDLPEEFTLLVPASGGGMLSGIARAIRYYRPSCEVIGVQPEKGGAIYHSLQSGKRISTGKVHTLADALVASLPGENTFKIIQEKVDQVVLVSEEEIERAIFALHQDQHLVVEGGGSVAVAALLAKKISPRYETVVCVLSGGNIDKNVLQEILARG